MSIDEHPSSIAYFNRAAAFLNLGDTCSYCNDLKKASGLYDKEASDLYDKTCKFSTIDKNIPDSLKAKYHDIKQLEIIYNKCNSDSTIVYVFENKWNNFYSAASTDTNSSPIFTMIENMPSYVGGAEERVRFFDENLRYPVSALKSGVQGTVYISIIVDSTGIITSAKIVKGIGAECDEEAMRVVGLMPKWIPGKHDGQYVRVILTIPVKFNIARQNTIRVAYYNQAQADLKAGDTCKSCINLMTASTLGDKVASKEYENMCVKYETIREAPDSILMEYPGYNLTLISKPKCNSKIVYTYYNKKKERISSIYEVPPEFPDGEIGRTKFLQDNIRYPKLARVNGIEGTVVATFTMDETGQISDVKILRGIGGGCDEEVVRVIYLMPRWKPATLRGKPILVEFNMSINYSVSGNFRTK